MPQETLQREPRETLQKAESDFAECQERLFRKPRETLQREPRKTLQKAEKDFTESQKVTLQKTEASYLHKVCLVREK